MIKEIQQAIDKYKENHFTSPTTVYLTKIGYAHLKREVKEKFPEHIDIHEPEITFLFGYKIKVIDDMEVIVE